MARLVPSEILFRALNLEPRLDLEDAALIALASSLAPGILRIGGSLGACMHMPLCTYSSVVCCLQLGHAYIRVGARTYPVALGTVQRVCGARGLQEFSTYQYCNDSFARLRARGRKLLKPIPCQ